MRIGVISDSHGDVYAVKRAIKGMGSVDIIVHLGDLCRDAQNASTDLKKDIIYVKGNCDYSPTIECDKIIQMENKKVLITHGHNYNVKSSYNNLSFKAQQEGIDLVLFGHTHFAEVLENNNIIFVNPGSLSRPRGPSKTFAVVTVDRGLIVPNLFDL